jgi:dihydroorotate dehydrogenase electron transfer subunit
MIQQNANVVWNRPVSSDCWHLGLGCDGGYREAVPGQFVMVRVGDGLTPLLRRPFSIFGLSGDPRRPEGIEILYKTVGQGTLSMTRLQPGQAVDLLGPLGHGFTWRKDPGCVYLAAGGIGVAPIRFLAAALTRGGVPADRCHVFLGGRCEQDLLCRDDFEQMGMPVTLTTDDGSAGDQCLITDPLTAAVAARKPDALYACGPPGMLKCVAGLAGAHQLNCQISIETVMACGLGACLGCAVPAADQAERYLHVCLDGPVFDARRVVWE